MNASLEWRDMHLLAHLADGGMQGDGHAQGSRVNSWHTSAFARLQPPVFWQVPAPRVASWIGTWAAIHISSFSN